MDSRPLIHLRPVKDLTDHRGGLSVIEKTESLPFPVRRVYWIHGTKPDVARGFHAHRRLRQLCICLAGSVRILMFDGQHADWVTLAPASGALDVPPMIWHEMHDFSPDCILAVFADAEYDEADYIRDRAEFIRHVHSS
jgi:dTDP-4-dehydrorhamnose 3,5-epimerase-like enzyme